MDREIAIKRATEYLKEVPADLLPEVLEILYTYSQERDKKGG